MTVPGAPRPKRGGEDIVQRLRAKLWDSGYKLSSKKIEAFLDYIADSAMSQTTADDDEDVDGPSPEDGGDDRAADSLDAGVTHAHVDPTSADARVRKLQHDVDKLEYHIMKYISRNAFPLAVKCPAKHFQRGAPPPTTGRPRNRTGDPDGLTWEDPDEPRANTRTGNKKTLPKKSDPVAMFHKMQALWRRTEKNFPRASSKPT